MLGNPDGDVTIVEFFDYRCPYCKLMAPRMAEMLSKDSGLRLVMKEYPILSRPSIYAAKVALVAARHNSYAAFHTAMFALAGPFDDGRTLQVAQSVGLSRDTVQVEVERDDILGEIRRNIALGALIGFQGTPAFIVNGVSSQAPLRSRC